MRTTEEWKEEKVKRREREEDQQVLYRIRASRGKVGGREGGREGEQGKENRSKGTRRKEEMVDGGKERRSSARIRVSKGRPRREV